MQANILTVEEKNGAHILTCQIEGDGRSVLFGPDDVLTGSLSVEKTASGGAKFVVSIGKKT